MSHCWPIAIDKIKERPFRIEWSDVSGQGVLGQ